MTTRATYAANTLKRFVKQLQSLSKASLMSLQYEVCENMGATPFLVAVADEINRRLAEVVNGRV